MTNTNTTATATVNTIIVTRCSCGKSIRSTNPDRIFTYCIDCRHSYNAKKAEAARRFEAEREKQERAEYERAIRADLLDDGKPIPTDVRSVRHNGKQIIAIILNRFTKKRESLTVYTKNAEYAARLQRRAETEIRQREEIISQAA